MKGNEVGRKGLPAWLDAQTVAVVGTVLTVAVGIAAMILVSVGGIRTEMRAEIGSLRAEIGGLRAEMRDMRRDLTARIDALDVRLRGLEQTVAAIQVSVEGLAERLRVVGAHTRKPLETAQPREPPDG